MKHTGRRNVRGVEESGGEVGEAASGCRRRGAWWKNVATSEKLAVFHVKHETAQAVRLGMRMVSRMESSVSCRRQSASTPAVRIMVRPLVTVLRKNRTSLIK